MNIHEHQAKEILKEFGVPVPKGIVLFNVDKIQDKAKELKSSNLIIKAQIHAGGRGKAGGIKLVSNKDKKWVVKASGLAAGKGVIIS